MERENHPGGLSVGSLVGGFIKTITKQKSVKKLILPVAVALVISTLLPFGNQIPLAKAATATLSPTSVGSLNDWSGHPNNNNAGKVSAVQTNDADASYINGDDNHDRQTFNFPGAGISLGSTINSVKLYAVARGTGNGGQKKFSLLAHHNSDNEDGGNINATSNYAQYSWTMSNNPFTHSPWTLSEVNSWTTTFGVERENSDGSVRVTQIYLEVDYSLPAPPATWTISGFKFNDLDSNGVWDKPDEPGLGGWTISLDGTGETQHHETTTTLADGSYSFTDLAEGQYVVSEVLQDGWTQTYPESGENSVTIKGASVPDQNFGNHQNSEEPACNPEAELITNGSFETPVVTNPAQWDIFGPSIPGWTATWMPGSGDEQYPPQIELQNGVNGWLAQDGQQYTEMDTDWDGPGGGINNEAASIRLAQTLSTVPGRQYTVSFWTSPRPGLDTSENQTQVWWDGVLQDTVIEDGTSNANTVWTHHSYTLTATGTTTGLAFADVGTADSLGAFLDNVSVRALCPPPEEQHVTIVAHKIVCDSEADLPNWGNGGPDINADTAQAWVAQHPGCRFVEGWNFQWGPQDAYDPGDTLVGPANPPWQTIGPTDSNGEIVATLTAEDIANNEYLWFREELKDGYIPFTFDQNNDTNIDPVSAELYCHIDVLNYDNRDRIDGVQLGQTYNCVGFNALIPQEQNPCDFGDQTGWFGQYYNYDATHPDMNLDPSFWPDKTHGDPMGSWNTDWYDSQYLVNSQVDPNLTFGPFFPLDAMGEDPSGSGHNYHFGVHWSAAVTAGTSGDYNFTLNSDDDSWVYLDGTLVKDNSGIHPPTENDGSMHMTAGTHIVDIFFAERHTVLSAMSFAFANQDLQIVPYNAACQPPVQHTLIGGMKFEDFNGDGSKNGDDHGLQDWTIYAAQQVASFDVDSHGDVTGTPIDSPALDNGAQYLVRVFNTFDAGDSITADAKYSVRAPNTIWTDVVQNYEGYGPTLLDLQLDGVSPDWGAYNSGHVYWHTITGTGAAVTFQIYDIYASNNVGKLNITLYKVLASTLTDINGDYSFDLTGVDGDIIIAEQTQDGWVQTDPLPEGFYTVNGTGEFGGKDFGNQFDPNQEQHEQLGSISGKKIHDHNGDGIQQGGDEGLGQWTIYIDVNDNGIFDGGDVSTFTAGDGSYSFPGLDAGTYIVREVGQGGWTQVWPNPPAYSLTIGGDNWDWANTNFGNITNIENQGNPGGGGGGGGGYYTPPTPPGNEGVRGEQTGNGAGAGNEGTGGEQSLPVTGTSPWVILGLALSSLVVIYGWRRQYQTR